MTAAKAIQQPKTRYRLVIVTVRRPWIKNGYHEGWTTIPYACIGPNATLLDAGIPLHQHPVCPFPGVCSDRYPGHGLPDDAQHSLRFDTWLISMPNAKRHVEKIRKLNEEFKTNLDIFQGKRLPHGWCDEWRDEYPDTTPPESAST